MKDLTLLTWLTQLGLTVAFPLGGSIWLSVWIRNRFELGSWVLWLGIALGALLAFDGLRTSLKTLSRITAGKQKESSGISFNEHD